MFRHYRKTFRINIPEFDISKCKHTLSKEEVRLLLAGEVDIEEKLDGANSGIVRHKNGFKLQKKGSLVGPSEHAQFQFFHNWANYINYNKLMEIPIGYIVYGELMFAKHSIFYESLPDYFLVFDVWNGTKYLNGKEKQKFCSEIGLHHVPIIKRGYFNVTDLHGLIPELSAFGQLAEGIVVKRYNRSNYMRGKIVKPGFMKTMEENDHWTKQPLTRNKLGGTL